MARTSENTEKEFMALPGSTVKGELWHLRQLGEQKPLRVGLLCCHGER